MDGIVEVVLDDLCGDQEVYLEPMECWQDYLLRLARGLRRVALARPQIFPLIATRPPQAPWIRPPLRSLRWIDSFLGALAFGRLLRRSRSGGIPGIQQFPAGHLLLEVAAKGADNAPVEMLEPPRQALAVLDTYPHMQRLELRLSEDRSAEEFEKSLENLLHRIKAPQLSRTPDACEDWDGWSGIGWQSRCRPFHPAVVTHQTLGPARVSCYRLVRPLGGRPAPARPTSVT